MPDFNTMTNEECVRYRHSMAVVLTRLVNGKNQYRISPEPLRYEGMIPHRGFLSNWCSTEERAWRAAVCRQWHKTYSRMDE